MCPFANTVSWRLYTRSLVDMDISRLYICHMYTSELALQACPWIEGLNLLLPYTKETGCWERIGIIPTPLGSSHR